MQSCSPVLQMLAQGGGLHGCISVQPMHARQLFTDLQGSMYSCIAHAACISAKLPAALTTYAAAC